MKFPYLNNDGVQIAVYPTVYMNITQVPNGGYSHTGRKSVDEAGKDTGKDDFFAPFDSEVEYVETKASKTGVQITNTCVVECADGTIRNPYTIHHYTYHDNDISDLYVGKKLKQGEVYYQEGTAGEASGNHVHFNVGIGTYKKGTYPLKQNEFGKYEVHNEIDPTLIFYTTNEHIIKNKKGMKWKQYVAKQVVVKPTFEKGAVVKFINPKEKYIYYTTRQPIPSSVKSKQHVIGQMSDTRVLLVDECISGIITKRGVYSWVFRKDLELVK